MLCVHRNEILEYDSVGFFFSLIIEKRCSSAESKLRNSFLPSQCLTAHAHGSCHPSFESKVTLLKRVLLLNSSLDKLLFTSKIIGRY